MRDDCIQIKYEGGCTSVLLPQFFDECTLPKQRKFYKLMATWAAENREDVQRFRERLTEEIETAKKDVQRAEHLKTENPKEAAAEIRLTKNRLKRLTRILADFDAAMEQYDYTKKRQGGKK